MSALYQAIEALIAKWNQPSGADKEWFAIRQEHADELQDVLNAHASHQGHKFWGAGEADCPADIKASNGELHTLRCKVCGADNNKKPCFAKPDNSIDIQRFRPAVKMAHNSARRMLLKLDQGVFHEWYRPMLEADEAEQRALLDYIDALSKVTA